MQQIMNKLLLQQQVQKKSAGQTTISVTDASVFGVGDIVNFGETNG